MLQSAVLVTFLKALFGGSGRPGPMAWIAGPGRSGHEWFKTGIYGKY